MFKPGETLTFTHAKGTRYEKAPILVTYVRKYEYGFDEHVVTFPDGNTLVVLERDLS